MFDTGQQVSPARILEMFMQMPWVPRLQKHLLILRPSGPFNGSPWKQCVCFRSIASTSFFPQSASQQVLRTLVTSDFAATGQIPGPPTMCRTAQQDGQVPPRKSSLSGATGSDTKTSD
eukprot:1058547-Amphidinium_carterae.1